MRKCVDSHSNGNSQAVRQAGEFWGARNAVSSLSQGLQFICSLNSIVLLACRDLSGSKEVQFWEWQGQGKRKTHRIAYAMHGNGESLQGRRQENCKVLSAEPHCIAAHQLSNLDACNTDHSDALSPRLSCVQGLCRSCWCTAWVPAMRPGTSCCGNWTQTDTQRTPLTCWGLGTATSLRRHRSRSRATTCTTTTRGAPRYELLLSRCVIANVSSACPMHLGLCFAMFKGISVPAGSTDLEPCALCPLPPTTKRGN